MYWEVNSDIRLESYGTFASSCFVRETTGFYALSEKEWKNIKSAIAGREALHDDKGNIYVHVDSINL
jgi:hypothetical protein